MDNYKIKVNDEAESKEAQELLFQLGYEWYGCGAIYNSIGNYTFITAYPDEMKLRTGWGGDTKEELTLPQLRDLVVLHRNDVKDANCIDKKGEAWYLTSEGKYYAWQYRAKRWDVESDSCIAAHDIKPIQKPQPEQGLISGADALRALADGKEIQWVSADFKNWNDLDIWNANLKTFLNEKYIDEGEFKFRLKPRTISLSLEIPAPFEPKVGEVFFVLYPTAVGGYSKMHITDQKRMDDYAKLGAWRTEEEIKQVVAALRGD